MLDPLYHFIHMATQLASHYSHTSGPIIVNFFECLGSYLGNYLWPQQFTLTTPNKNQSNNVKSQFFGGQLNSPFRAIKRHSNVWCSKQLVQCYIIVLKLYIVHINTMKSEYKTIGYHGALGVSIDRNGCAVLIFKGICANDASILQAVSSSHS